MAFWIMPIANFADRQHHVRRLPTWIDGQVHVQTFHDIHPPRNHIQFLFPLDHYSRHNYLYNSCAPVLKLLLWDKQLDIYTTVHHSPENNITNLINAPRDKVDINAPACDIHSPAPLNYQIVYTLLLAFILHSKAQLYLREAPIVSWAMLEIL